MKMRLACALGLSLGFVTSGYAINFTRDAGDTRWSNLGQWNYYDGSNYVDALFLPSSSDLILLNAGKTLSVDTNAFAGTIKLPNATTDATLELHDSGQTLTVEEPSGIARK